MTLELTTIRIDEITVEPFSKGGPIDRYYYTRLIHNPTGQTVVGNDALITRDKLIKILDEKVKQFKEMNYVN